MKNFNAKPLGTDAIENVQVMTLAVLSTSFNKESPGKCIGLVGIDSQNIVKLGKFDAQKSWY